MFAHQPGQLAWAAQQTKTADPSVGEETRVEAWSGYSRLKGVMEAVRGAGPSKWVEDV